LWGALRAAEGAAARDAVWAHPDLLPQATDLDDPLAFAERTREADNIDVNSDEFDAELNALLQQGATPAGDTAVPGPEDPANEPSGSARTAEPPPADTTEPAPAEPRSADTPEPGPAGTQHEPTQTTDDDGDDTTSPPR
jgi:hypothetical protein